MEKKKLYSKFQYFFWLISGSEISSLKDCPEDYNRHANIGMMILITSIFAFGTAFIAGMTFANSNPFGVFLFSIIWGTLIFALDRSMVNSIKRDPEATVQPFWSYFIPRFILAFILAFFMSVPLDHIVFPEAIERQMNENNQQDWLTRQEELNLGYDVERRDSSLASLSQEVEDLDELLASDCPLPEYQIAKTDYNDCRAQINPLKYDFDKKVTVRKAYYSKLKAARDEENRKLPDSLKLPSNPPVDNNWWELKAESDLAYKKWKDKEAECISYKKKTDDIYSQWRSGTQADRDRKDSLHQKQELRLRIDRDSIRIKSENFKTDIDSMTGFDTKFTTLFLMPNWGVQVLKWAIFLALLVIEILPTYLKLRTPIGEYDVEISKKEKAHRSRALHFVNKEDEIAKESEQYRKEKEVNLNKEVVDRIAAIELRLANESLDIWESEAIAQIKTAENGANNNPK